MHNTRNVSRKCEHNRFEQGLVVIFWINITIGGAGGRREMGMRI